MEINILFQKMKKSIFLIFLLFSSIVFAQNYRAIYELKFKPSKEKDSIITEQFALDIFPKLEKVSFYNYSYFKNDSVMSVFHETSERQGGVNIDLNSLPKAKFPVVFIKENNKTFSLKTIDGDSYKFEDSKKPIWKVLKETKKIKNWNCQKAETEFLGRKWTAWFTSELAFPEGPYKFSNLPGLIAEIYDSKNDYHFILEAFFQNSGEYFMPTIFRKPISVNKKQYEKAWSNYVKDPAFKLRQSTIVDESGNVFNINGGFSKKFIDKETQERLKKIKDFDNPIDLN